MNELPEVNPANSTHPAVLDGAITEADLAKQLDCCVRTLADIRRSVDHPPFFKFNNTYYYRVSRRQETHQQNLDTMLARILQPMFFVGLHLPLSFARKPTALRRSERLKPWLLAIGEIRMRD